MTPTPITVSPEEEKQVVDWATLQINTALTDRAQLEERWQKWIKQYEEELPKKKMFPWKGCSNVSVPVTPIAVETIHAREVNTLFSVSPYMQVRPKVKGIDKQQSYAIEKFYEQVSMHVLDLYSNGSSWLLEKNKMGTSFLKAYWNYEQKKIRANTETGFAWSIVDDAKIDVIPIEDLIFPVNAKSLQTALFVDHRIRTTWTNLQKKAAVRVYNNIDKIKAFVETQTITPSNGSDIKKTKEDIEKVQRTSPAILQEYEIHEIWFDYDVDKDGYPEQTVMTFHKPSGTVLRWILHPYDHGKRPFIENTYMERVGRVYGKGIAEMSEYLQDATNTIFNQTIDNQTIANAKIFLARPSVKENLPKDGVFPGCTIYTDDPTSDLHEMMMGDIKQSSFALLTVVKDYHERRTKVTDYSLGKESSMLKSRATATGTLALLQESGRHFDLVINNSRKALVELAYQVIELYMQYNPNKVFEVTREEQPFTYMLPKISNLREEYEFYCSATSLAVNKEIEKQTNLLLLQQLSGLFQQMIQLLMMIQNPQMILPPDVSKFIAGVIKSYFKLAEDLIRSFEKVDVASYLPEVPDIVKIAYGQGGDLNSIMAMIKGGMNGNPGAAAALAGLVGGANSGGVPPEAAAAPAGGMAGGPESGPAI